MATIRTVENSMLSYPNWVSRKASIEEYIQEPLDVEIYDDLAESEEYAGLFDPHDFFHLLDDNFAYFYHAQGDYVSIKERFSFSVKNATKKDYYFYWALNELIQAKFAEDIETDSVVARSCDVVTKMYEKISAKIYPEKEKQKVTAPVYDFENVKQHIATLTDVKAKIIYLTTVRTEYLQNKPDFLVDFGTPFDEKCDLEILKQKEILRLQPKHEPNTQAALPPSVEKKYNLGNAISKIDYIRVINALWELRSFQNVDGTLPTKQEIMTVFGKLVDIDLSGYSNSLNKAFNSNVTEEQNIEIFNKLTAKTVDTNASEEQNTEILDKLKAKTSELYQNKQNKPKN